MKNRQEKEREIWRAYFRETETASDEYDQAIRPAEDAYNQAIQPAQAKRNKALKRLEKDA